MEKKVPYEVEEQPEDGLAEAVDEAIEVILEVSEDLTPEAEAEDEAEVTEDMIEAFLQAQRRIPRKAKEVDEEQLATVMLSWARLQRQADKYKEWIEKQVLLLGKTVTVGYVRATFSQPRKSYDYETPCRALLEDAERGFWVKHAMQENTKEVVDWRAVSKAEYVEVEPVVTEGEGPGSVSVKLLR